MIVGGREDRVVPVASLRELAIWLSADFRDYSDHGHWIIGEGGGDGLVREKEILLAEFGTAMKTGAEIGCELPRLISD